MGKATLLEQLENYDIEDISYCQGCGAYTVTMRGEAYSVHMDNFFKFFPDVDEKNFQRHIKEILLNNYSCCNWSVNGWGLDLCACGSRELLEDCENGMGICGDPMQKIGEYAFVRGEDAWI